MEWGCTQDAPVPLDIDGVAEYRCPRRPIFEDPGLWNEVFWLYSSFKQGFLPQEGGLENQPALLLEYLRHVDLMVAECEEERRRQEKVRGARKGKPKRKGGKR